MRFVQCTQVPPVTFEIQYSDSFSDAGTTGVRAPETAVELARPAGSSPMRGAGALLGADITVGSAAPVAIGVMSIVWTCVSADWNDAAIFFTSENSFSGSKANPSENRMTCLNPSNPRS